MTLSNITKICLWLSEERFMDWVKTQLISKQMMKFNKIELKIHNTS